MTSPLISPRSGPPAAGPLPPLLVVADSGVVAGGPLLPLVERAIDGGARAVWLREKGAEPSARRRLAAHLAEMVHAAGGILISSPGPGCELADGIHLAAGDARKAPVAAGRSCHGRAELDAAAGEGCAWATLSPIFVSPSKPRYGPALGTGALADTPLPTWALGGVDAGNAAGCLRAGAAGVAVMGAVLAASDPGRAVAEILEAIG